MFEDKTLDELIKVYPNGINVLCPLNTDSRAIVQFSSNHVSTLRDFLKRLKPVLHNVLKIIKNTSIPLKVVPSLSFGVHNRQATLFKDLANFNINDAFEILEINTNEVDGGYFELEIIHKYEFNPQVMYRYNQRQNDDDDSEYNTESSVNDDDDADQ